jgi:glutamate racemase
VADARPIGILDSGIGGLSVLDEITRRLPSESTVYLADTLRAPYGTRSDEEILGLSRESLGFLVEQDVKAVVVASGTLTAVALRDLRREVDVPIIGAVQAGAAAAARATRMRRVGVIGSTATIRSHAWFHALKDENPAIEVVELATPAIGALLSAGRVSGADAERVVAEALAPIEGIDTLALGGSGYPLLRPLIQAAIGERVAIVDSVLGMATAIVELLSVNGIEAPGSSRGTAADPGREGHDRPAGRGGIATHVLYVNGDVAAFRALADRLFGVADRDVRPVPDRAPSITQ